MEEEPPSKQPRREEDPPGSQSTPPKDKTQGHPQDLPSEIQEMLSKAVFSNKTVSCFVVYTTHSKGGLLYRKLLDKFCCSFLSRHGYNTNTLLYMLTPNKHRVSAVYNYCNKYCSISFLIVKAVIKQYELYVALCKAPFTLLQESVPGGLRENYFTPEETEDVKIVSWKKVSEFALAIMCDDVHLLMGLYAEFAQPLDGCKRCEDHMFPNHFKHHANHIENAQLFSESKNQKSICQQGVDAVIAKLRVNSYVLSRREMLVQKFQSHLEKMELMFGGRGSASLPLFMAGVAWLDSLFPTGTSELVYTFLECIVENIPKRRYWLFTGPVNTGKTTLAAGLLDLCGGKALNINMPFERINFELGVAIDQFMVVFEDVKGQPKKGTHLPAGQGVSNLDNLRDYLDGSVKVNLEKKHLNKRTQIFPPGVVTMNEYSIPPTLKARFSHRLLFKSQPSLFRSLKATPDLSRHRVLQSGITLLLMLIYYQPIDRFASELQAKVAEWKGRIDSEVGDLMYIQMKENVMKGQNILAPRAQSPPPSPDTPEADTTNSNETMSPTATQM